MSKFSNVEFFYPCLQLLQYDLSHIQDRLREILDANLTGQALKVSDAATAEIAFTSPKHWSAVNEQTMPVC